MRCTVEEAVKMLNEALVLDPTAMNVLFSFRVPCNTKLADHPTIQVRSRDSDQRAIDVAPFIPFGSEPCDLGVMGLINGLFGADDKAWGFIESIWSDEPELRDRQLLGFKVRVPDGP